MFSLSYFLDGVSEQANMGTAQTVLSGNAQAQQTKVSLTTPLLIAGVIAVIAIVALVIIKKK